MLHEAPANETLPAPDSAEDTLKNQDAIVAELRPWLEADQAMDKSDHFDTDKLDRDLAPIDAEIAEQRKEIRSLEDRNYRIPMTISDALAESVRKRGLIIEKYAGYRERRESPVQQPEPKEESVAGSGKKGEPSSDEEQIKDLRAELGIEAGPADPERERAMIEKFGEIDQENRERLEVTRTSVQRFSPPGVTHLDAWGAKKDIVLRRNLSTLQAREQALEQIRSAYRGVSTLEDAKKRLSEKELVIEKKQAELSERKRELQKKIPELSDMMRDLSQGGDYRVNASKTGEINREKSQLLAELESVGPALDEATEMLRSLWDARVLMNKVDPQTDAVKIAEEGLEELPTPSADFTPSGSPANGEVLRESRLWEQLSQVGAELDQSQLDLETIVDSRRSGGAVGDQEERAAGVLQERYHRYTAIEQELDDLRNQKSE